MSDSLALTDVPFGPFEGRPIRVYLTKGRTARFHVSDTCSLLRSSEVRQLTVPFDHGTVRNMCHACTRYGSWTRRSTALGLFVDAVTGLRHQLQSYIPGELDDELPEQDLARAAELLSRGDWPDDEDDDHLWKEFEDARSLRDSVLLPNWQGAADSLHAALDTVGRYPWLVEWAQPRLAEKADYVDVLRRQLARLIAPQNLVDSAALYFLDEPEVPVEQLAFAVFGEVTRVRKVLKDLWWRWHANAVDGWGHLEDEHSTYAILHDALGQKRKGRDEAHHALNELLQQWTDLVHRSREEQVGPDRWVVVTLPELERSDSGRRRSASLSLWQLGVIVTYTVTSDWLHRAALLRVPDVVARRLLDEKAKLHCVEPGGPMASDADPATVLATWSADSRPDHEHGLLPGVLDDGPIVERRRITAETVRALRASPDSGGQLYLVYSLTHGIEVTGLAPLAARCRDGWHGVIVAGANDLPDSLVTAWTTNLLAAFDQDVDTTQPDSDGRYSPENPHFGSDLGVPDGERRLFLYTKDRGYAHIERHLRILAIARAAEDLRVLGNRYDDDPPLIPPDVWYALLSPVSIDLTPFLTKPERPSDRGSALGLPLSVLSSVQLYTTNSNALYGKGHSPTCQHAPGGRISLDSSYDILTVADLLQEPDRDWCSKCGGYAVRRLTQTQVRYYRAAHWLHEINRRLDWHIANSRYTSIDTLADLLPALTELAQQQPDPDTSSHEPTSVSWQESVRAVEDKARRICALAEQHRRDADAGANVVPLRRDDKRRD